MATATLNVEALREHFPALHYGRVLFNNAAGSAVLKAAIASVTESFSSLPLELDYSDKTSIHDMAERLERYKVLASFVNASHDEIVVGHSATQLFRSLTHSIRPYLNADSEIIVSTLCHEAGCSAWIELAKSIGVAIKWWTPPPSNNPTLNLPALKALLTPKTRLVACNHVSNVLGTIHPIREVADLVHTIPGALLSVDGVAWAPHRPIDVKALDVDFYTFSWYKVLGPHIAQMYIRRRVQERSMISLNHHFLDPYTADVKLRIGCNQYELEDSCVPIVQYINQTGWDGIVTQETILTEALLTYLRSKSDTYTIFGDLTSNPETRVSLVTFCVKGHSSKELAIRIHDTTKYRISSGQNYAPRPVYDVLKLPEDGLLRVSLLHYNTVDEVKGFTEALENLVFTAETSETTERTGPVTDIAMSGGRGEGSGVDVKSLIDELDGDLKTLAVH